MWHDARSNYDDDEAAVWQSAEAVEVEEVAKYVDLGKNWVDF